MLTHECVPAEDTSALPLATRREKGHTVIGERTSLFLHIDRFSFINEAVLSLYARIAQRTSYNWALKRPLDARLVSMC